MSSGILAIGDRLFVVTEAELWGYFTLVNDAWVCRWNLDIETEEREFPSKYSDCPAVWKPRAYAEHLHVRSWHEFDGITIAGEDEQDAISLLRTEPVFRLYVYTHEPVADNQLQFKNRHGNSIDLVWTGRTDFSGEDKYAIRVEAKVKFAGVSVSLRADDPAAPDPDVAAIFASALDPADFEQLPTSKHIDPDSGRPRWRTEFVPKSATQK